MGRPKGSKNKSEVVVENKEIKDTMKNTEVVTEVEDGMEDVSQIEDTGYEVSFDIEGLTPLGFGIPMRTTVEDLGGKNKENQEKLEKEYFRERVPVSPETGNAIINNMAFKKAIVETGKKYKKSGMMTYGNIIKTRVDVTNTLDLGIKAEEIKGEWMYVPLPNSNNSRGWKQFPRLAKGWETHVEIYVVDKEIDPKTLEQVISKAGLVNGLGLFRPQSNGGSWGKFKVKNFKVKQN